MATETVTEERLNAGRDYLSSLERLGFRPDALLWTIAADRAEGTDVRLSLVSGLVERYGPREIYDLLYAAYDKAGTPKSVDPWVVSLYGPGTRFARELAGSPDVADKDAVGRMLDGSRISLGRPWVTVADRLFQPGWVYRRTFRKPDIVRESRQMDRLRRNVQALAA